MKTKKSLLLPVRLTFELFFVKLTSLDTDTMTNESSQLYLLIAPLRGLIRRTLKFLLYYYCAINRKDRSQLELNENRGPSGIAEFANREKRSYSDVVRSGKYCIVNKKSICTPTFFGGKTYEPLAFSEGLQRERHQSPLF